jgi:hypothetical protein
MPPICAFLQEMSAVADRARDEGLLTPFVAPNAAVDRAATPAASVAASNNLFMPSSSLRYP